MGAEINISVVIPVYNNADTLVKLTKELIISLRHYTFEVIFVNDYSIDESHAVLNSLALDYSEVKYINLPQNVGQQEAILEGLKVVTGDKIVVLDADLQDNPKLIPELYVLCGSGSKVSFVKRKGRYQASGKMITSVIFKLILQLISGLHYKAGSYFMFSKALLPNIIEQSLVCQKPYMSIIVAHCAEHIMYLPAERGISFTDSGYNFSSRLLASHRAIRCAVYCRLRSYYSF